MPYRPHRLPFESPPLPLHAPPTPRSHRRRGSWCSSFQLLFERRTFAAWDRASLGYLRIAIKRRRRELVG